VNKTGNLDPPTRELMAKPRCGMPDMLPGEPSFRFITTCAWWRRNFTYAFHRVPDQLAGGGGSTEAKNAVRRAFNTWAAASRVLTFTEVPQWAKPDFSVDWRAAFCADEGFNMGRSAAHAEYPIGCEIIASGRGLLPQPLHFNNEEFKWSDGAVRGALDIESTALHEIGHLLGLTHDARGINPPLGNVMYFIGPGTGATMRTLQDDDVTGLRTLYRTFFWNSITCFYGGKLLDVRARSTANGVQIQQWHYVPSVPNVPAAPPPVDNQRFRAEKVAQPSHRAEFRFVAFHSGKVLDVDRSFTHNGAKIIQWDWHGGPNQRFRVEPEQAYGANLYKIVAVHSGKVLDVDRSSFDNGAEILQWDWHGGTNQLWKFD